MRGGCPWNTPTIDSQIPHRKNNSQNIWILHFTSFSFPSIPKYSIIASLFYLMAHIVLISNRLQTIQDEMAWFNENGWLPVVTEIVDPSTVVLTETSREELNSTRRELQTHILQATELTYLATTQITNAYNFISTIQTPSPQPPESPQGTLRIPIEFVAVVQLLRRTMETMRDFLKTANESDKLLFDNPHFWVDAWEEVNRAYASTRLVNKRLYLVDLVVRYWKSLQGTRPSLTVKEKICTKRSLRNQRLPRLPIFSGPTALGL